MDIATISGIIIALGSIAVGYSMAGGILQALWMIDAVLIVVGGCLGSVAISYSISDLIKLPLLFLQAFKSPKSTLSKTIDYIVMLSEKARKDGLLSIEKILTDENPKSQPDPLLKQGILMVIDGVDLDQIRELLETEVILYEEKGKKEVSIFESMAAYAPAYGMIGTIMGLIQVLANMDTPETLATSISVAFITTLYGVLIANVICQPIAGKLKLRNKNYIMEKEMIIEGVCSIRNGQNPKMLRDKLSIYLKMESKGKAKPKKDDKKVK